MWLTQFSLSQMYDLVWSVNVPKTPLYHEGNTVYKVRLTIWVYYPLLGCDCMNCDRARHVSLARLDGRLYFGQGDLEKSTRWIEPRLLGQGTRVLDEENIICWGIPETKRMLVCGRVSLLVVLTRLQLHEIFRSPLPHAQWGSKSDLIQLPRGIHHHIYERACP